MTDTSLQWFFKFFIVKKLFCVLETTVRLITRKKIQAAFKKLLPNSDRIVVRLS